MLEAEFERAIGDWASPLPQPRVAVYRNNVVSALVNALQVRFPVTAQLVGQAFFSAMARAFVETNRPGSPVLIAYGEDFPHFIRRFAPAAGIPYLGDVAQLEGLWWRAYHAADRPLLAHEEFAGAAPERWGEARFEFHPSLGLMQSDFAAAAIWQAHHGGAGLADINTGVAQSVLIWRPERQVMVRAISPAAHDFIAVIGRGASLADAVERLAAQHADFNLALQLQGLLGLGIITGFDT